MARNIESPGAYDVEKLRFYPFQHPFVCTFIENLQADGINGLLARRVNQVLNDTLLGFSGGLFNAEGVVLRESEIEHFRAGQLFENRYSPTPVVAKPYPPYVVDFDMSGTYGGAYATYNWELFFHIPVFIATRLMQDQRHEEAMRWFHYMFNPMTDDNAAVPQRYWNFKPFRDEGVPDRIQDLLWTLQDPNSDKKDIEAAIEDWREHPFEPHRIARGRPGAYMKMVLMKYLDNLIDWGDKLFRRDTIESINEAIQLYILAANLLGVRPQRVPTPAEVKAEKLTYYELRPKLDKFSNVAVLAENLIIHSPFTIGGGGNGASNGSEGLYGLANLAFCIPHNDTLLGYWDTVEDRLFKIRHCMNIEGVVRELPLFEPPIDPALLVRATAMGLDLSQVLDDLAAPLPHYRFTFMLQKAREFCEELKQLGSLLLSALEKKDTEKLAQTRAAHEKALLEAVREVKKQQINEAENTHASLEEARAQASLRQQFYANRTFTITGEKEQLEMLTLATVLQTGGQGLQLAASFAHGWPDQFIGSLAGAGGGAIWLSRIAGGSASGASLQSAGRAIEILGGVAQARGTASGILAGYRRRADDWKLQADIASADIKQIDKQIAAADIRRQIAENELANHEKQIEQAGEIEDFLREKFTNQDLYTWMVSKVSAVYFQAYKLAYDMAKRAERTYRMELGIDDSAFIQFGAWDNLRKGLLAGERLSLDLRRLDQAYLANNKREHEVTKHVSLALLNPGELLNLRETGSCEFSIPELLFDLDFPGHYFRRIKSVRLTIPCVAGPYTSVNAKLTLLNNRIRKSSANGSKDKYGYTNGDPRFLENLVGIQSIATSSAQNDAGLFELNFRDERYLPFEGSGVISRWRLELPPPTYRQFDYDTISDVIMDVSYTARDGGNAFKAVVTEHITNTVNKWLDELADSDTGLPRLFSLRQEFPNSFYQLLNPSPESPQSCTLKITRQHFPYFLGEKTLKLSSVVLYLKPRRNAPVITTALTMTIEVEGSESTVSDNNKDWKPDNNLVKAGFSFSDKSPLGVWTIEVGSSGLNKDQLEDILLLLTYIVKTK